MSELNEFEIQLMLMLLNGEDDVLRILREQLTNCEVCSRKMTGTGFFSTFRVDDKIESLPSNKSFKFGDVHAEVPGLKHGAGFLLYIDKGRLDMLEGYTYDEGWPKDITKFQLSYIDGKRDLEKLKLSWK